MKYINSPIKKYMKDLGANLPAPGGGSAAALTAGLGVSLLLMVVSFTEGNKAYKGSSNLMKRLKKQ